MTHDKKSSNKYNPLNLAALKYFIFIFIVCLTAFSLLKFPATAAIGVRDGINSCLKSIIPSLFPFMVISCVFMQSSVGEKFSFIFEPITRLIFKQKGCAFSVIVFSQIGGFPVGANLINQLYIQKKITKNQAKRLLLFCINPGPAFVISFVGNDLLHSKEAGIIIYCSVVLSSIIFGFFSRFLADGEIEKQTKAKNFFDALPVSSVTQILTQSVKKSGISTALICCWVVIFSCVTSLIDMLNISGNTKIFVSALLEVTNGCKSIAQNLPASLTAGAIGWSGLCIHFQIMDSITTVGLKLKHFLVSRILNAAAATVICELLFKIFPQCQPAIALLNREQILPSSSGIPISVCLICMCVLFMLGDSVIINKKKKSITALSLL